MGKSSLHDWHSFSRHPYMHNGDGMPGGEPVVIARGIAMWYTMHERRLRKDW